MAEDPNCKLRTLPPPSNDVRAVLEKTLAGVEELDAVLIIATRKQGGQIINSSSMMSMEKAYLISFLQAWYLNGFDFTEG